MKVARVMVATTRIAPARCPCCVLLVAFGRHDDWMCYCPMAVGYMSP